MNANPQHAKGPYIFIRQRKTWTTKSGYIGMIYPYDWILGCRFCPFPWRAYTTDHQDALEQAQKHLDAHWDGWKYTPQIKDAA